MTTCGATNCFRLGSFWGKNHISALCDLRMHGCDVFWSSRSFYMQYVCALWLFCALKKKTQHAVTEMAIVWLCISSQGSWKLCGRSLYLPFICCLIFLVCLLSLVASPFQVYCKQPMCARDAENTRVPRPGPLAHNKHASSEWVLYLTLALLPRWGRSCR